MGNTSSYGDGSSYEGEFRSWSLRHGNGKLTYPDGEEYDGEWRDDKQHGKGKRTFKSGATYEGEFCDNKQFGKGKLTCPDGGMYDGEWRDDKQHGNGKRAFKSGVYEGDFCHEKRHGKGKFTYPDGDVYEGEWSDDRKHGWGKYTYSGCVYEGEWRYDKKHGKGKCCYYGDVYEGEWRNDERHGWGKCTYPDSHVYEGEWSEWFTGTHTDPSGHVINPQYVVRLTPRTDDALDSRLPLLDIIEACTRAPAVPLLVDALPDHPQYVAEAILHVEDLARSTTGQPLPLTQQAAAVALYTTQSGPFQALNAALRDPDRSPRTLAPWLPYLRLLMAGLLQLPVVASGTVVYRGMDTHPTDARTKFAVGRTVQWCSLGSSSTSKELSDRFAAAGGTGTTRKTQFTITTNGQAFSVAELSFYRQEGEVLFPLGSRFEVTSFKVS
eukprot:TRINITY_DN13002_c0_g1_i3.p1 TRINITY_DN13002_c0_g1~~TRINITY_DN13002_c0_g1_i3.p1  ORF type:complete len:438 (+),score=65.95 TRINITY_DN13002_c0_g1_i3:294-1607(+)